MEKFEKFDFKHQGFLIPLNFQTCLLEAGVQLSSSELEYLLQELPRDGLIDFEEFTKNVLNAENLHSEKLSLQYLAEQIQLIKDKYKFNVQQLLFYFLSNKVEFN